MKHTVLVINTVTVQFPLPSSVLEGKERWYPFHILHIKSTVFRLILLFLNFLFLRATWLNFN